MQPEVSDCHTKLASNLFRWPVTVLPSSTLTSLDKIARDERVNLYAVQMVISWKLVINDDGSL